MKTPHVGKAQGNDELIHTVLALAANATSSWANPMEIPKLCAVSFTVLCTNTVLLKILPNSEGFQWPWNWGKTMPMLRHTVHTLVDHPGILTAAKLYLATHLIILYLSCSTPPVYWQWYVSVSPICLVGRQANENPLPGQKKKIFLLSKLMPINRSFLYLEILFWNWKCLLSFLFFYSSSQLIPVLFLLLLEVQKSMMMTASSPCSTITWFSVN